MSCCRTCELQLHDELTQLKHFCCVLNRDARPEGETAHIKLHSQSTHGTLSAPALAKHCWAGRVNICLRNEKMVSSTHHYFGGNGGCRLQLDAFLSFDGVVVLVERSRGGQRAYAYNRTPPKKNFGGKVYIISFSQCMLPPAMNSCPYSSFYSGRSILREEAAAWKAQGAPRSFKRRGRRQGSLAHLHPAHELWARSDQ